MTTADAQSSPGLTTEEYDGHWANDWSDFIRYNPGARHRRRLILKMLAPVPFVSALDAGCGNGELLSTLRRRWPERTFAGADLSPEVIARNRRRFPGVRFHLLNLEEGALDEQFDLVTCSEVVEHLNRQERGLRHLAAMTKPRGHVLVTCPTGAVYPTERTFGHVAHPSLADVERYARASGLDVVAALNWGWPLYKAMKWATNVNSRWALEHFASGRYTAVAKLSSHAVYYANFANVSSARGCQLFVLMQKR